MSANSSFRLREIIRLCGTGEMITDIGCDHAFADISLTGSGAYRKAVAADVREGPLAAAAGNIAAAGLSDRIQTRLSDGLENIKPREAENILISGMGGDLIITILRRGRALFPYIGKLILGPQSHVPEVRRFLHENGFKIDEELFIKDDGKYYTLIRAVPGAEAPYTDEEYAYGKLPVLAKNAVLSEWLEKRIKLLDGIITGLEKQMSCEAVSRRQELEAESELAVLVLKKIRSDG